MIVKSSKGQVLLEWLFGASMMLLFILGGAKVLKSKWSRLQCASITFSTTHKALLSGSTYFSGRVQVLQTTEGVTGKGHCDGATEKVEFKHLDDLDGKESPW
jgi:hypothetical protein